MTKFILSVSIILFMPVLLYSCPPEEESKAIVKTHSFVKPEDLTGCVSASYKASEGKYTDITLEESSGVSKTVMALLDRVDYAYTSIKDYLWP